MTPSILQRILGANSKVRAIAIGLAFSYTILRWPQVLVGVPDDIKEKLFSAAHELLEYGVFLALWFLKQNNVSGNGTPDDPHRVNEGDGTSKTLPLSLVAALLIPILLLTPGCGTPAGIAVADFLESPANQAVITAASNGIAVSLTNSLGSKFNANAATEQATQVAISSLINGVTSGGAYAAAQALRTKQSTDKAAAPGAITAAVTQSGTPEIAPVVATAVTNLTKTGVPADAANEAVASALDAVAAKMPSTPDPNAGAMRKAYQNRQLVKKYRPVIHAYIRTLAETVKPQPIVPAQP